ncbi:TetR/AcrR family transcriptional regulator [soil metagenome]
MEERQEQIVSAAYEVALRTGIDGVTLRAVAAQAGLSHGLVLFHFRKKDQLIDALLDRVLAITAMPHASEDIARIPQARGRFGVLLRLELSRLARNPRGTRLFFEYWALGVRKTAVRRKIAAALGRYRAAFQAMAEELSSAPRSGSDRSPAALAAVAVSLINGFAVQAMMDPKGFDTAAYVATVEDMIEALEGDRQHVGLVAS